MSTMLQALRRTRRKLTKRYGREVAVLLAHAAKFMGERLPRKLGLWLFGIAGRLMFLLPTVDKQRTIDNLRLIYGKEWSEKKIRATAGAVYRELGRNLFDALHLAGLDDRRLFGIVRCEGEDEFLDVNKRGIACVAITCHLGCFEMELGYFGRRGLRGFAIGRKLYDRRIDDLVTSARKNPNVEYLYRSESPRAMMRKLAEGKCMGVLIDQDTNTEGVFSHFLGRVAYTPSGPVKLAMRMGIPLFVASAARQPDDTHLITVSGRVPLDSTGDFDVDLVRNVEKVNAILSERIAHNPEQWVWMHRRWRRRPEGPGMEKVTNIEKITNHKLQISSRQKNAQ